MISTCDSLQQIESKEIDSKSDANIAPWIVNPHGVVSLLAMYEYGAAQFYKLSQALTTFGIERGLLLSDKGRAQFQEWLDTVHEQTAMLGMTLSNNQVAAVVNTVNTLGPRDEAVSREIHELQRRISEELEARTFKWIPEEKAAYLKPVRTLWLMSYGELRVEVDSARRCYAYGENTACVFHLMRVVDWGLRRVADSLGIAYEARNWSGIGKAIQDKMELKHKDKSDDWKKAEPFYAQILTDIQALSRGHRNPALHEIGVRYDEREAHHLLTVVEGFIRHVLTNIQQA